MSYKCEPVLDLFLHTTIGFCHFMILCLSANLPNLFLVLNTAIQVCWKLGSIEWPLVFSAVSAVSFDRRIDAELIPNKMFS
jgi:hypothetical protein